MKYTKSHEWINDAGYSGISQYAQDSLGDIVFVELPEVGAAFEKGSPYGAIESVKAASDLYAPVSGKIIAVNDALNDAPETVNSSPEKDGWIIQMELSDPSELDSLDDASTYRDAH